MMQTSVSGLPFFFFPSFLSFFYYPNAKSAARGRAEETHLIDSLSCAPNLLVLYWITLRHSSAACA